SPYLLTLDADSVLLPEYTERLVGVMEQPGNESLAVLQTPYATFPGATAPVERVAGATTDVQLLLHQGYSQFGATFWVGANALLRRAALDDIAVTTRENGHPITRYVQDRTVIEDTESTLDLIRRGWRLHNHGERLAYSATPSDFGTLVIQRRRWACGGLLILPKLFRQVLSGRGGGSPAEFAIRFHYLASLAYGPVAVLLMLLYPFDDALGGIWLPLTALPYFLAYGRDLAAIGYRWRDLGKVYALNLLLVPIHLAGSMGSLRQALTGRKTPFRRTPKVDGRTSAPRPFVLVAWGLPLWCGVGAMFDLWLGNALHAAFAGLNAALFGYAAAVFVGPRASLEDLLGHSHLLVRWLDRDRHDDMAARLGTVPAA
ncbi:MAG: glycosyltransferase family 2 protein, partial [Geminicoccaceae bacterium]